MEYIPIPFFFFSEFCTGTEKCMVSWVQEHIWKKRKIILCMNNIGNRHVICHSWSWSLKVLVSQNAKGSDTWPLEKKAKHDNYPQIC